MNLPSSDVLNTAYAACGVAVVAIGWFKYLWPRLKAKRDRFIGIVQTIGGRDAIIDKRDGTVISPAVPHLGEQLSTLNDTVAKLVAVIESNHDAHKRLDQHDQHLADHDSSIAALIGATFERGATAALTAAEKANADVIDEPTE